MSEAKKTNTFIEKTILLQKSLQIHMKKCHKTVFQMSEAKKTNTLIEKTILLQKCFKKSQMKKRHRTAFQNA